MSKQELIDQIELVSAGMGEVNEKLELAALEEWLTDEEYNEAELSAIQAEWTEYATENEVFYQD